MNRRSFFATLLAPVIARLLPKPKPTTGGLFNPHQNIAAMYKARPPMYSFFYDPTAQPMIEIWPKPRDVQTTHEIMEIMEVAQRQIHEQAMLDRDFLVGPTFLTSAPKLGSPSPQSSPSSKS